MESLTAWDAVIRGYFSLVLRSYVHIDSLMASVSVSGVEDWPGSSVTA